MKKWEVWREGYAATGDKDGARFLGIASAFTFAEACAEVATLAGLKQEPGGFDRQRLTVWGCQLYDNEGDARRAFG